ncbi:MAG TPA: dihydrolipoamide acetyltransferase family protein [Chloroflexota bacterium]
MATEVVMPRLSDTMDSGTVARWLKHEGDEVKRGEIIAEIETDKANMELESYANGVLARIIVNEGQSASLGEPIAMIAADTEEAKNLAGGDATQAESAPSPDRTASNASVVQPEASSEHGADGAASASPAAIPEQNGSGAGTRIKASPLARRLAQEHGVDLNQLLGSGPGGRITKDDVQAYVSEGGRAASAPPSAPTPPAAPPPVTAPEREPAGAATIRASTPVDMTRMQNTIARRMAAAKFSAPDFALTAEYDMTEARNLLRQVTASEGATKVGPNDLLIRATAVALTRHPEVNAGWENDGIVRYGRINVGFAVAVEGGLVVPVIRDADKKTLGQIAAESKALIEKARTHKLAPSDYEGGTFSISNLGMYGIDEFTPIINVPEACIVGVGAITPTPVVVDGQVVVRDRMKVTLSCDHRVLYGAEGAEFLRTLRGLLENPLLSLL